MFLYPYYSHCHLVSLFVHNILAGGIDAFTFFADGFVADSVLTVDPVKLDVTVMFFADSFIAEGVLTVDSVKIDVTVMFFADGIDVAVGFIVHICFV